MPSFTVFDLETGGVDPAINPPLSLGCVVTNQYGKAIAEREWLILPWEGSVVEPSALAVNGIDLERHLKIALPGPQVFAEFAAFSREHHGAVQPRFMGFNICQFDIPMMRMMGNFASICPYFDVVDVFGMTSCLRSMKGLFGRGKLSEVAIFLGLEPQPQVHNAVDDCRLTLEVYHRLRDRISFSG